MGTSRSFEEFRIGLLVSLGLSAQPERVHAQRHAIDAVLIAATADLTLVLIRLASNVDNLALTAKRADDRLDVICERSGSGGNPNVAVLLNASVAI